MARPKFLRVVPREFLEAHEDPVSKKQYTIVTVMGDKISPDGSVKMRVPSDQIFQSTDDLNGQVLPGHFNIRMDPDKPVAVTYQGSDGRTVHSIREPAELVQSWKEFQGNLPGRRDPQDQIDNESPEAIRRRGPHTWLDSVSPDSLRETRIPELTPDGSSTGRFLLSLRVPDPESKPRPDQRSIYGYGTLYISPGDVRDIPDSDRKRVYLGRENDVMHDYVIYNGHAGSDGEATRDSYSFLPRTAREIKELYEGDQPELEIGYPPEMYVPPEETKEHKDDDLGYSIYRNISPQEPEKPKTLEERLKELENDTDYPRRRRGLPRGPEKHEDDDFEFGL